MRLIDALASDGFECMLRVKTEAGAPVYEVQVILDGLEHTDLRRLEAAIGDEPHSHGHIVGGTMEIS
jgi:hypothetical protein